MTLLTAESGHGAPAGQRRQVWIVDDSPLEAEQARRSLDQFGTRIFSDGATLLEQIVASPMPDVLILDWMMPDLTGIEVCKFLRTQAATSELAIVLLTSQSRTEQIVEGLEAGANDYLTKPYFPAELCARVISQIRAKSVREMNEGVDQQASAALRKTELRYRALVEGLPDLLIVVSKGRIVFMNPLAIRTLATGTGEALLGQPVDVLFPPGDLEAAMVQIAGGRSAPLERRLLRPDGSLITTELSAQAVVFDGEPAIVVTARDISAQKEIQGQLMVSERMASVGMLAAGVAHEINNPLASVLANLDFARAEVRPFSDNSRAFGEIELSLTEARESGERVREIVQDLKLFSHIETTERRGSVDVHRVLELSLRMAANEIRHRARLVKNFGAVRPVMANDARLGQVFLNLIVNAAQAIPDGKADQNEVVVATREVGDRVVIEVSDTGPGMDPTIIKNLFTPFFTTKTVGTGTGLGLSICHRIITNLGGEIQVASQVGKGSTFRVLLDAAGHSTPPAPAPSTPRPDLHGRRGRVLVIDDDTMVANAIERTLRRAHDVTVVNTAKLGLEQVLTAEPFDVIFCDLMMPVMTGMEFYEQMVELAPESTNRIVFLSGGSFTTAALGFLEGVPNLKMDKPFEAKTLLKVVGERVLANGNLLLN